MNIPITVRTEQVSRV